MYIIVSLIYGFRLGRIKICTTHSYMLYAVCNQIARDIEIQSSVVSNSLLLDEFAIKISAN